VDEAGHISRAGAPAAGPTRRGARAELITLAVPWHEEDGAASAGAGAAFRDPVFYVMNSVPNGLRLTFPPAAAIQPPLPELPQARAPAAAPPPPVCVVVRCGQDPGR